MATARVDSDAHYLIDLRAITKRYSGVTALNKVDFSLGFSEAVCLVGENGSGKSTLIKIISGVEQPTEGQMALLGQIIPRNNPRVASANGITVIFQDFSLFSNLPVYENIAFPTQMGAGRQFFDRNAARKLAGETLERIGVRIDLGVRVEDLPVAQKQLVAICRALASDARLIIMDEPTTALTEKEVQRLLSIIRKLKADGVAVIFVSHKLAEVLEVSEKVVVLRNGEKVAEGPAKDFETKSLTFHMTGRDVPEASPAPLAPGTKALLRVAALGKEGVFSDINFELKSGELLGITGLLGSGRTSLAKALFGLVKPDAGQLEVKGNSIPLGDPIAAAEAGIGYVPEDRLTEGLFLTQSIRRNVAISRLDAHSKMGFLDRKGLFSEAADWIARLKVKAPDMGAPVQSLSGGNQQRVALARWLSRAPQVLILNGPSVGVDVGSKADIHDIIRDLASKGMGVIVISDDLPELLATCQRILVMRNGRITDELAGITATEADLAQSLAS